MTEAPYPEETRAKGWRFELDHERIRQSDTWALAAPEHRPWLLMLWMVAWEQTPCGSLPDNDALIAARLGMASKAYTKARETLRRGWYAAEDGRLYHATVTERVQAMLVKRAKDAKRAANNRERLAGVAHESRVTSAGSDQSSTPSTKHQAPEKSSSEAIASAAAAAQAVNVDAIFALGLPMLAQADISDKQARKFLGFLRKHNDDRAIAGALKRCADTRAIDPVSFLQGCLKTGVHHINRQEAIERDGKRVAAEWLQGASA